MMTVIETRHASYWYGVLGAAAPPARSPRQCTPHGRHRLVAAAGGVPRRWIIDADPPSPPRRACERIHAFEALIASTALSSRSTPVQRRIRFEELPRSARARSHDPAAHTASCVAQSNTSAASHGGDPGPCRRALGKLLFREARSVLKLFESLMLQLMWCTVPLPIKQRAAPASHSSAARRPCWSGRSAGHRIQGGRGRAR